MRQALCQQLGPMSAMGEACSWEFPVAELVKVLPPSWWIIILMCCAAEKVGSGRELAIFGISALAAVVGVYFT
eukprot:622838-Amphidinium_carterae.1